MKKALSIILALAMILALGACAKADEKPVEEVVPEADEKPVIAVVPKAVDNPLNQATKVGAERAGEELGFEVLWTGTPDTDSAGQVQVIESLIQKGVDGILMSANDPDALKDVINKAMEAGIPVATWDSDSAESNRLFYAGTDNYHLGYACGEKMVELAEGKEDFKVVVLHGTPGASNLETRIDAFEEALADKEATNIEIVSVQTCNDDNNYAVDLMESYTLAHPDVDAWYVIGGWPFFGSTDSMPNLAAWAADGGIVVAIDTFWPCLQFVKDGLVTCEYGQDFDAMGYLGATELFKVIKGAELSGDFVDTNMNYCDAENLEYMLSVIPEW